MMPFAVDASGCLGPVLHKLLYVKDKDLTEYHNVHILPENQCKQACTGQIWIALHGTGNAATQAHHSVCLMPKPHQKCGPMTTLPWTAQGLQCNTSTDTCTTTIDDTVHPESSHPTNPPVIIVSPVLYRAPFSPPSRINPYDCPACH